MQSWLESFVRLAMRQTRTPGAPARTSAPVLTQNPQESGATLTTAVTTSGTGAELLILGEDELENPEFYLGDDPIDPYAED